MAPFRRTIGIVFTWFVSTQLLLYPYTKISPAQTVALIVAGTGVGLHDGFAYLRPRRTIGERVEVTKKHKNADRNDEGLVAVSQRSMG